MSDKLRTVEAMLNSLEPRQTDVEVRQEDCEAAADAVAASGDLTLAEIIRDASRPSHPWAITFAAYRIAAERRGAEAAIEAAAKVVVSHCRKRNGSGREASFYDVVMLIRAIDPAAVAKAFPTPQNPSTMPNTESKEPT